MIKGLNWLNIRHRMVPVELTGAGVPCPPSLEQLNSAWSQEYTLSSAAMLLIITYSGRVKIISSSAKLTRNFDQHPILRVQTILCPLNMHTPIHQSVTLGPLRLTGTYGWGGSTGLTRQVITSLFHVSKTSLLKQHAPFWSAALITSIIGNQNAFDVCRRFGVQWRESAGISVSPRSWQPARLATCKKPLSCRKGAFCDIDNPLC